MRIQPVAVEGWIFASYVLGTLFGIYVGIHYGLKLGADRMIDQLIDLRFLRSRRDRNGEIEILKYDEQ